MKVYFKISLILIGLFIFFTTLGSILMTYNILNTYDYTLFIACYTVLLFLFYIFGIVKKHIQITIYDVLIYALIMFGLISVNFAYDIDLAIFGFDGRNEGFLTLISYYFIFLISRQIKEVDKNKVIYLILFLGLSQIIFAICQLFDFSFVPFKYQAYYYGFLGNSNFFSTFCLLGFSLAVGLFMYKKSSLLNYFLICVYLFGIVLSNAMSGFVGLCFVIFLILFTKKIKEILIVISTVLIIFLFGYLFIEKDYVNDIIGLFYTASSASVNGETGNYRIYIWSEIVPYIDDHLVNGIGISNLVNINEGSPIRVSELRVFIVEAHNELLHVLITQGLFAFLTYIVLYGIIIVKNLKTSDVNKRILFIAFTSYIVQAIFNISVIQVAPYFFIVMGMLASENNRRLSNEVLYKKEA